MPYAFLITSQGASPRILDQTSNLTGRGLCNQAYATRKEASQLVARVNAMAEQEGRTERHKVTILAPGTRYYDRTSQRLEVVK
ncbi:hypothetical protein [Acidocella sp.]|jgi:hypothetical protein|uniref:hypothetical protein n=1 Tax=Acidocella sp. TaxID=50710 RepID=UPI002F3F922F